MFDWINLLDTLEYLEGEGLIRSEHSGDDDAGVIRYYPAAEPWLPEADFLRAPAT